MKKSININSREWCDLIFKDKNQLYGAYEMRMTSSKRHIAALGFTFLFAIAAAGIPLLISSATALNKSGRGIDETYTLIEVMEEPIAEEPIDIAMPEPPSLREQIQNTIAYNVPIIGEDIDVPDDATPPTMEDLLADHRTIGYMDVDDGTDDVNAEILREERRIVDDIPEAPIDIAEVMPQFPGGEQDLMRYISQNLKYPVVDQENGIQGRVIIRFVVSKTGAIEKVEVLRGVSPSMNREATRVVESMPKWIPGRQNGQPVAVFFTLPIHFQLR